MFFEGVRGLLENITEQTKEVRDKAWSLVQALKISRVALFDPSAENKKNMTQNRFNETLPITETDRKTQKKKLLWAEKDPRFWFTWT